MEPIHVIHVGRPVDGVTSLGGEVFLVRNLPQVDVFDANTMSPTRTIPVPGLGLFIQCGLTACSHNKCLYVVACNSPVVRRICPDKNKITKWSAASSGNYGLSVDSSHNVIIAGWYVNKLYEYTTHGQILKTITLPTGWNPRHAVQLPGTAECLYGVTHHGPDNGCSVVDEYGAVVRSYAKSRGCGPEQMRYSCGIAINRRGFMFIADCWNSRILVVNTEKLGSNVSCDDVGENDVSRVLPVSVDGGLRYPLCLWLDESRDRLYIGECLGCRVVVVGHVNNLMF